MDVDWHGLPLRSWLFAPASDERKLAKLGSLRADVVVLDLEDAVADAEKPAARAAARRLAAAHARPVAVRVNAPGSGLVAEDIAAVVAPGLAALVLPKVETYEHLATVDELIAAAERSAGIAVGSVKLLPLIETALGLAQCESLLADAPARVLTAVFGSGDFATDLGIEMTPDAGEILYARSRLVVAARAGRLPAPVDGPWCALDDVAGLASDSRRSSRLGFQGRVVLHPGQVDVVESAYSIGVTALEWSQRVVDAFEAAESDGVASVRVDGQFVDYAIYRGARERLGATVARPEAA